ncbi:MAG TPA: hypothetical protein VFK58_05220 [Sphingomicrobium sp.]|nr:hypothetical protein [Sphingomicrobium sp.]
MIPASIAPKAFIPGSPADTSQNSIFRRAARGGPAADSPPAISWSSRSGHATGEARTAYLLIGILTVIASLLVFIGLRYSDRSSRPKLFRIGSVTAAAGLMLLWIAMWWALAADRGIWQCRCSSPR